MKDFEEKFGEIEKRVRALVARNKGLADRVKELEQELSQARRASLGAEHFHGTKLHIKEKIEHILQTLEAVKTKE